MSALLLWSIVTAFFIIGTFGTIIPGLPGLGLVFAGVLFYGWATNWVPVSTTTIVVMGLFTLVASLADWYGSGFAAKLGGGKRKAFWGTLIGGLAGLLLGSAPGFLLGAFIGALVGALAEGKGPEQAGKIAVLSLVGILGARLMQLVFAIAIIIAFFIAIVI